MTPDEYEQNVYDKRAAKRRQDAREALPEPEPVKVGDPLAFTSGNGHVEIHRVERITPTGRITCGPYRLDNRLRVTGRGTWSTGPVDGERVTPEHVAAVRRRNMVGRLRRVDWRALPSETLSAVCAALDAAAEEEHDAENARLALQESGL